MRWVFIFGMGALCVVGSGSAAIYTPERHWAHGHKLGEKVADEPLAVALRECVRENDPSALPNFDKTGSYRVSGLSLPEPQTSNVATCELLPVSRTRG
jgi:hypothetical protein